MKSSENGRPMARKKKANKSSNGATLGFEQKLWPAADKMREYTVHLGTL